MSNKKIEPHSAELYLEMWLSEQIPIQDWIEILKKRKDVKILWEKHLENNNG